MAGFDLTANVTTRLVDVRKTAQQLKRQLSITAPVQIKFDASTNRNVKLLSTNLNLVNKELQNIVKNGGSAQSVLNNLGKSITTISKATAAAAKTEASMGKITKSTKEATSQLEEFGRISGLALRRNAGFVIATGVIFGFTRAVSQGVKAAVDFQKELVKVSQVSRRSIESLKPLTDEISSLSKGLGVSSKDLIQISVTLAQAGLSANQTRQALEALAKTSLAATFGDIQSTTEGAVAIISQFGIRAKELESALGSINAVAAQFAVESGDIIAAVKRAGGVFAQTSKGVATGTEALQQFIATFTSVRATTRESAESIATGLRTILTRIQRPTTIQYLRELGVELTDIQGKFVGPFEALNRLAQGFGKINPRNPLFASVIEELGGFRQVSKVIPLIVESETRLKALQVAQQGQTSLTEDAAQAQLSFSNVLTKVHEEFTSLIRDFTNTSSFRSLLEIILQTTKAFADLARTLVPILPLLTAAVAIKGVTSAAPYISGFVKKGLRAGFARGGLVTGGSGVRDDVPADLMSGEFVIRKDAVKAIGISNLNRLNRKGYAAGGAVENSKLLTKVAANGLNGEYPTVGAALFKPEAFSKDTFITVEGKYSPTKRPLKFRYIRELLDRNDSKQIKGILRDNILNGINDASSVLGSSSKASGLGGARLLRNLGEGQILGPLFEGILLNISQGGLFTKTTDPNRPFDFVGGLQGPLRSVFTKLANVSFVDAKYSSQAAEPAGIKKKIINQLAIGERFGITDQTRYNALKGQAFGRKGLMPEQRKEFRGLGAKRRGFASGGVVPAILTGGEYVLNKGAANSIGASGLHMLNNADRIGFATGTSGLLTTEERRRLENSAYDGLLPRSIGRTKLPASLQREYLAQELFSDPAALATFERRSSIPSRSTVQYAPGATNVQRPNAVSRRLGIGTPKFNTNLAIAASIGATTLGQQIGGSTGAAISGGVGGATTGALLGSLVGKTGVGAILGGVYGAFKAFTDAQFDAKIKSASEQMIQSIENIEKAIQDFSKNNNERAINEALTGFTGSLTNETRALQDQQSGDILTQATRGLTNFYTRNIIGAFGSPKAFQEYQDSQISQEFYSNVGAAKDKIGNLKGIDDFISQQFDKSLNNTSVDKTISSLTDERAVILALTKAQTLGRVDVLSQFGARENQSIDKQTEIARTFLSGDDFKNFAKQTQNTNKALYELERSVLDNAKGVNLMLERITNLSAVLDRISEVGEGNRRNRASIIDRRSGGLGIVSRQVINPFSNIRGRTEKEISRASGAFNLVAGNTATSRELFQGIAVGKQIQSNLPRVLNQIIARRQDEPLTPSDIKNIVNKNFNNISPILRQLVSDKIGGRVGNEQASPIELQRALQTGDLQKDIESVFQGFNQAGEKFVEVFNKNIAEYEQVLNQWVQLNREANQQADRVIQTEIGTRQTIEQIVNPGRRFNAFEANAGFFAQQDVLSRRAGLRGPGRALDFAAQEDRLNRARGQIANDPTLSPKAALDALKDIGLKQDASTEALRLIADNTGLIASLQEDLNDVLDRRGATRRAAIDALTNPGQALRNRLLSNIGDNAIRSGAALPSQLLGEVLGAFDTRNALAGGTQQNAIDIQNRLIGNAGNFGALRALSPELNQNFLQSGNRNGADFFGAAAERAQFAGQIGQAVGEQIRAQQALAEQSRRDANDFLESGSRQFQESVRQLNELFQPGSVLSLLNQTLGQLPEEITVGGNLTATLNIQGLNTEEIGAQVVNLVKGEVAAQIAAYIPNGSSSDKLRPT